MNHMSSFSHRYICSDDLIPTNIFYILAMKAYSISILQLIIDVFLCIVLSYTFVIA